MSEEYSPYAHEQDAYAEGASPLPYVDTPTPLSDVALPPDSPQSLELRENVLVSPQSPLTKESRLAEAHQVGRIIKEYKHEAPVLTITGVSATCVGILLWLAVILILRSGWVWSRMAWMLIAGFVLIGYGVPRTLSGIYKSLLLSIKQVQLFLCTDGVMYMQGRRVRAIRWDQMQGVQKSTAPGKVSHVTTRRASRTVVSTHIFIQLIIYPFEGKPLKIDSGFIGFGAFGSHVEQEVSNRLLPGAIAAYKAGQTLNFGALDVTPEGLKLAGRERLLPWDNVTHIRETNEGELIIYANGKVWETIEVISMLNICLLLPLVYFIRKDRAPDTTNNEQESQQQPVIPPPPQSEWHEYE